MFLRMAQTHTGRRRKPLELRLEARSRLTHNQYWTLMERIGERSKQVRSEETKRLHKKEKNIEKRNERFDIHVICN